jgi:hypothetical protein
MTTSYEKMGEKQIPKMLCITDVLFTMDNIQHNIDMIDQPLSQSFRES